MSRTKKNATKQSKVIQKADQYNDSSHNYLHYWDGRDYEQAAEEIMLHHMLKGRHFKHAVDVGGGYGRLSVVLRKYADKVTLAEPSQQQLDIAKEFLSDKPKVDTRLAQAENLPFKDGSVDLAMVVRVIHHLPNPQPAFDEIYRILEDGGYFLIEFANYANFKNRLRHLAKGKKIPIEPVDIRTGKERSGKDDIPFVNHNPATVKRQLMEIGFKVEEQLSVSNFRSTTLKKYVPKEFLVRLEKYLQKPLAKTYFGPSTVYLLKKI